MPIDFIKGDILTCPDKCIAHQTNCVSVGAGGLAAAIFNKFPYSDVYRDRSSGHKDVPGTILVSGGPNQRFVIHMMAQYYPGYAKYEASALDGVLARQNYFQQCLDTISELVDLDSISFPYKIGCGLAGGDWSVYLAMITKFSDKVKDCKVSIWVME